MSLQFLLDSQKMFQNRMGTDFETMTREERSKFIKEHGYFLIEETVELLRESPFHKSWKDYSNYTEEQFDHQETLMKEEAVDALHFLTNLFLALGMTEEEVLQMYKEKNKLNYKRQEDSSLGYVKGKAIIQDPQH